MNLTNPISFILKFVIDLYLFILILRMLLQFWRANFYNPFCQLIITLTDPIRPILQKVPAPAEFLLLVIIFILEYLKMGVLLLIQAGAWPALLGSLIWIVGETGRQIIQILFFSVLINILLAWIPLSQTEVLREVLIILTEPLLRPVRRMLPLVAGFDLSPIPVLFGLELLSLFVINPILVYGSAFALHGI